MSILLTTPRLNLRTPEMGDELALKKFYLKNREHLSPWESKNDLIFPASESVYKERIALWKAEEDKKIARRFFLFHKEGPSDELIGMCNFSQIYYDCFHSCYLGYKIGQDYQGMGLMAEAARGSIHYMFEELKLHRIMANYMPHNERSGKLLKRLGFVTEGYAEKYLLINDRWEDYVLTALSYENWILKNSKL